ncbi:MAG: hypothetical protein ACN4GK_09275 [Acidimicrobiia bacterium]
MEHDHQDGGPGTRRFRIWVQGRLDERFSEGLAGIEQRDVPAGTMLSGVLLDQSQLHSTFDLLRSLGIDVLRFEVDPPPALNSTDLADRGAGHDQE